MLTRDQIFAKRTFPQQELALPEFEGSVYVRTLSAGEFLALNERIDADKANAFAYWVVVGIADADGQPLFTDADIGRLKELPIGLVGADDECRPAAQLPHEGRGQGKIQGPARRLMMTLALRMGRTLAELGETMTAVEFPTVGHLQRGRPVHERSRRPAGGHHRPRRGGQQRRGLQGQRLRAGLRSEPHGDDGRRRAIRGHADHQAHGRHREEVATQWRRTSANSR